MNASQKEILLPVDDYSERNVLGSIIENGSRVMDSVRGILEPDDFASQRHRDIWGAACSCYDAGQQVDGTGVFLRLREIGREESAGGLSYLADIMTGVLPFVDREVAKLKQTSRARRIMALCDNAIRRTAADREDDVHSWLLNELQSIGVPAGKSAESSTALIDRIGIDELMCPSRHRGGLRMPWSRLDNALGGLRCGQMIVVAAYTSRGKSSLACQIAAHVTRQETGVYYWTTEMSPEALLRRMVDQMACLDGIRHRDARLTHDELARGRDAIGWLYEHQVWFDRTSRSVTSMLASLRQVRTKQAVGLLVVDHLQHVKGIGRYDNRAREVSEISRSLKTAALDFEIPVLVVSQVSRPKEENVALTIHMLKESGDVENDADVVLLLNSPKPAGNSPVITALNIAKQREGPAGFDIGLEFHPSSQRFDSVEGE
jgi:replicative DNA helicase